MQRLILITTLALCLVLAAAVMAQDGEKMSEEDKMLESLAQETKQVRNPENPIVTLETNYGDLVLELWHDVAPAHADSFLARTNDGFYSGTVFHRIVKGFMIQGGDPTGTGTGGPGYSIPAEFNENPHVKGTLSMARARNPNSAGSQFFICFKRAEFLDRQYTVFGQLLKGYDTLYKLENVETKASPGGEKSSPVLPVNLLNAYQSDADGNPIKGAEEKGE